MVWPTNIPATPEVAKLSPHRSHKCLTRSGYFLLLALFLVLLIPLFPRHPLVGVLLLIPLLGYWLGFAGYWSWLKRYHGAKGEIPSSWPFEWALALSEPPTVVFTGEFQDITPREMDESDEIEVAISLFAESDLWSKKKIEKLCGFDTNLIEKATFGEGISRQSLSLGIWDAAEPTWDRLRHAKSKKEKGKRR